MHLSKSVSQKLKFLNITKNLIKTYKFKIFKKTTRFKKHNIGLTRYIINRKKYHNRKRRTTNLLNYYISSTWSLNYRKRAQLIKYMQTLHLFDKTSAAINVNYIFKKITLLPNVHVNTASVTKSLVYTTVLFNLDKRVSTNLLHNNAVIGYVYGNSVSKFNDFYKIQPFNNIVHNTSSFKEPSTSNLASIKNLFNNLTSSLFKRSVFFLSVFYFILIQLSLLCLYL